MKQQIIKLHKEGKSYNEISKILGCSKGTISYHIGTRTGIKKKPRNAKCSHCDTRLTKNEKKYCSNKCQQAYIQNKNIQKWLETGIIGSTQGKFLREYILNDQDGKCNICNMENVWNDEPIVFELDHVDGNPDNNSRENLRFICPNCHSQQSTSKGKNKGNGRYSRRRVNRRKRYSEGKSC